MACICANLLFPAPAWSSGAPPTAATSIQTGKQILFVEDNVADYRELIGNGTDHMDVVVLDGERDGLRQIAQALETRRDIAGLHLISHGAPGSLQLGSLQLGREQLNERGADLGIIRAALRRDADILLYGCNVAEGKAGQDFIGALAGRTGARVAASSNLTGAATQGGDWMLEARTGPLRSAALAFPAYRHVLPTVAGTLSIAANLPNNNFTVPKFVDSHAASQTPFPNIEYEIYFANAGNTPTGNVTNFNLGGPGGSMLIFDTGTTVGALIIKSQSNRLFGLSSFRIQDAQGAGSVYTATAYRGGTPGVTSTFSADPSGLSSVINLPSAGFGNVDEIRITSDGGIGTPNTLFQEGFNTFTFVNPSGNANLSALSATAGALVPGFAAATTAYTIAVPNATASTTITPTVDTPGTTVTVNGVTVASGAASGAIALNVGANTITTIVTALDGSTTKTYTTTITRAAPPSSNANLSNMAISTGTLTPVFASATTSYTAGVPFTTTSMTLTPTVADGTASVTVNGVATTSGNASGAIALNVGANTITTIVTAQDSSTKTYTTTVTRAAASSSNQLSALSLSSGTLAPVFASGTIGYTATVSNATTSITVTPTVLDASASVTVNGVATTSGNASGAIALAIGSNTITVTVTAQNGTPLSYTVTVTRAGSANADLSALSLSSGTLSPAFAAGTTSYTASVSNATTSLTVTPTVANGSASVTVNGVATTSGNASGAIALAIGSNTITVTVTAQNGTPLSYTVTVTRAGSANADLSALSLSSGTLSPAFAAGTTSYTASVSNATTSLTVTPTVANGSASVTVNGVATTSGNASGAIALNVGANTITTIVTAQDGSTTKTYTVTVTRAASSNNNLSALSTSSGSLSPVFNPATTGYTVSIAAGIASITVTPTTAVGTASITVNGVAVSSGAASGAIAMNPGSNTVTVDVTAQNGATKSYTLTITRALPSTNADLSALSLSSGTLNPAFAASTTSYTASVSNATTSLTVTPTVLDATASVTVNGVATTSGNASGAIALAVGANTVTTIVTAQNGTTTKTYTVTVTRAGSGDANLSALALSGGSLSPAFAPSTTGYTMSIAAATASVTVTPTVNEPNATVTVNGVAVASGNASGAIAMNTGSNTVTVVVTAQNSATRTYTVTVTRAISTNNDLAALALSSDTLNPVFSAAQQSYSATVPNATTSITVTPTVADPTATVTVNGVATTSGNASGAIALNTGANIITVVVTAQDGSPRSYTITVTRNVSSNADLSALALSSGTLSPAFAAGTTNYTASVSNATASLTVTPTVADPTATVTVNGMATISGNASGAIALALGANTITVQVNAPNGAVKTYTITVTRATSANAALSALVPSIGSLSPAFASATTAYAIDLPNSATALSLTPTVADSSATVTVNGAPVASASASAPIALAVGDNTVTIVVTAQNGTAVTTTVKVTRAPLATASLAGLVYTDNNHDGVRDSGETGMAGVTVKLDGTDLDGATVALSTVTGADGGFAFNTIKGGTYTLTELQPAAKRDGRETAGNLGGTVDNSGFDDSAARNQIGNIVIASGQAGSGYLFGEQNSGTLQGFVYVDTNDNGIKDAGETPLSGVRINLSGSATGVATSGTDGSFSFPAIAAGSYSLSRNVADLDGAQYSDGRERAGAAGGKVNDTGFGTLPFQTSISVIDVDGAKLAASGGKLDGYLFGLRKRAATASSCRSSAARCN
ncbi:Serine-aspartate repeat-containing protein F precursor [compost metagenome]